MDLKKQLENLKRDSFNGQITISDFEDRVKKYAETYHTLQLLQTPVSGSFFKCTCLHPQPSCLTGQCTFCNRPIVKNITTDDLKNCH